MHAYIPTIKHYITKHKYMYTYILPYVNMYIHIRVHKLHTTYILESAIYIDIHTYT